MLASAGCPANNDGSLVRDAPAMVLLSPKSSHLAPSMVLCELLLAEQLELPC